MISLQKLPTWFINFWGFAGQHIFFFIILCAFNTSVCLGIYHHFAKKPCYLKDKQFWWKIKYSWYTQFFKNWEAWVSTLKMNIFKLGPIPIIDLYFEMPRFSSNEATELIVNRFWKEELLSFLSVLLSRDRKMAEDFSSLFDQIVWPRESHYSRIFAGADGVEECIFSVILKWGSCSTVND